MAGLSIHVDTRELQRFMNEALARGKDPAGLLKRIGTYMVGQTKKRFQQKGPGWAPKSPFFAYWEGGKNKPLTYKGELATSIVSQVSGNELRVGSALVYARRMQLGGGSRTHFFQIEPERDSEGHVINFPNTQIPKGRFTPDGHQSATSVAVPMKVNVRPRPFLHLPDSAQWKQIVELCEKFVLPSPSSTAGARP